MSTNPPKPKGKFTGAELLSDVPKLLGIALTAQSKFQTEPKTAVDWATKLGFLPGSVILGVAAAYDQLSGGAKVTIDQVAVILGVDTAGVIGQTLSLTNDVLAQIASP